MDPSQAIIANLSRHISLTQEAHNYFLTVLEQKEFARKEYLLREGQVCRYFSFVVGGAFRAYHLNKEGKETTIMFAVADWWITDMYCFLHQQPAMVNIQALENSSVLQISRTNFDQLLEIQPVFEKYFRILMQNAYTREQIRVLENLSEPASERYLNFLRKYPQIVSQITQKQLASYLGITPEFLSTIRRQFSQNRIS
jgi:CRP-like cAMP-binding protein